MLMVALAAFHGVFAPQMKSEPPQLHHVAGSVFSISDKILRARARLTFTPWLQHSLDASIFCLPRPLQRWCSVCLDFAGSYWALLRCSSGGHFADENRTATRLRSAAVLFMASYDWPHFRAGAIISASHWCSLHLTVREVTNQTVIYRMHPDAQRVSLPDHGL